MMKLDENNKAGSGMPGLSPTAAAATMGIDFSKYKVRVGRFVVDENADDLFMLEALLNKGMNPSDKSVIIFDRKDNFNEGVYVTLIFYFEQTPEK